MRSQRAQQILFFLLIIFIIIVPGLVPAFNDVQSGLSLLLGLVMAISWGNPFESQSRKWAPKLLSYSVMGLGFGMNFTSVLKAGFYGTGYTVISISLTFLFGSLLSMLMNNRNQASLLVTTGTAICGGSAIAAVAPVIRAKNQDITVAVGTVFILNAIALFLFPKIGHLMNLSQKQFGLWSALAIHDTSSVVGTTIQYGKEALDVGTTIKMARALWIIPLTFLMATFYPGNRKAIGPQGQKEKFDLRKAKLPWFILGLLLAAALTTWVPSFAGPAMVLKEASKKMLVVTLFLIGANLNLRALKEIGPLPLLHGAILWVVMASLSLAAVAAKIFTVS